MKKSPRNRIKKKHFRRSTVTAFNHTNTTKSIKQPKNHHYDSKMFDDLQDPFQTELRLRGYSGKSLVLRVMKDLSARLKRLGIRNKDVPQKPLTPLFTTLDR